MQKTRVVTVALILAGTSLAQSNEPIKWPEIGLFGGYQGWDLWRSKFKSRPGGELVKGGLAGVRAGYDLTRHFGFEGAYAYGVNNLRTFPDLTGPVRLQEAGFGARNHHVSLNALWHASGPDSRLRPYLTAGIGAINFSPTDAAKRNARSAAAAAAGLGALALKSDLMPSFNWGGGIKYNLTDLLQLRFDARNIITRQPHFGLPPNNVIPGSAFMARGGVASGLQATAGVGFNLGNAGRSSSSAPGGPARRTLRGEKALRVTLAGGTSPLAAGSSTKLTASTNAPDPATVKYVWTVNGLGTDVTGPDFVFNTKGREPGDYKICSTATSSAKDWAPGSECYTVTITSQPALKANISAPVRVNVGETTQLTAGSDAKAGDPVAYAWTVNGQPVAGNTGSYTFNAAGRTPGVNEVCVTATANGIPSPNECTTVTVLACTNPTLAIGQPGAAEVFAGERVNIPVTAQPGTCNSPVKISFRAGDGEITGGGAGNSATGVLDSTNVAFDRTNRSKLQRKNVVVTATATDEKGNTATAQTSVVVKLAPMAQRLDDVLFAQSSSRVNNCGKRVLLELLSPKLTDDPEAKVVLIGHIDASENGVRRKANGKRRATTAHLDKARVLNAAAVISGGVGICPALDVSRIKVGYAGKAQASETRPTFCGSSTEVRATKRAGAKPDARAQFRRVEVWIVPSGAPMPAGVTIQDAPASEVKALKCPK